VKCGWCMGLTTLPPSMSRLSRQCVILNISQPYRPPRPVMGIAFCYKYDVVCYTKILNKYTANPFLCWASGDGRRIPRHIGPHKLLDYFHQMLILNGSSLKCSNVNRKQSHNHGKPLFLPMLSWHYWKRDERTIEIVDLEWIWNISNLFHISVRVFFWEDEERKLKCSKKIA
jgi:hypothetical protein